MRPRHNDPFLTAAEFEQIDCEWPAPARFNRIVVFGGFALAAVFLVIAAAVGGRI